MSQHGSPIASSSFALPPGRADARVVVGLRRCTLEPGHRRVYRWTDDKGVVHYGDTIPAEYSDNERSVLNGQGVEVGHVEGSKSAAQHG